MSISYKYVPPIQDVNKVTKFFSEDLLPLITQYWNQRGKHIYNRELQLNLIALIQMWQIGGLLIIVAYDGDKPVGILLGVNFTPLWYGARVSQIEVCFGLTEAIERGLFDYLKQHLDFFNLTEIWVSSEATDYPLSIDWTKCKQLSITRYTRE